MHDTGMHSAQHTDCLVPVRISQWFPVAVSLLLTTADSDMLGDADIVEIKHIMLPPSPREFKDIYVVFELMETDLHQVDEIEWL